MTPRKRPRAGLAPLGPLACWAAVLGWMALIFFLSAQPDLPHPEAGWAELLFASGSHALEFGVLAVLLAMALGTCACAPFGSRTVPMVRRREGDPSQRTPSFGTEQGPGQCRWSNRRTLLIAFLVTVLYAFSDEYHQSFVPGRVPDPWDLVCDVAGALVGLALWAAWRRRTFRPGVQSPR